jgi:hypothetical protein
MRKIALSFSHYYVLQHQGLTQILQKSAKYYVLLQQGLVFPTVMALDGQTLPHS